MVNVLAIEFVKFTSSLEYNALLIKHLVLREWVLFFEISAIPSSPVPFLGNSGHMFQVIFP